VFDCSCCYVKVVKGILSQRPDELFPASVTETGAKAIESAAALPAFSFMKQRKDPFGAVHDLRNGIFAMMA
jgi:hypothetical protein